MKMNEWVQRKPNQMNECEAFYALFFLWFNSCQRISEVIHMIFLNGKKRKEQNKEKTRQTIEKKKPKENKLKL